MNAPSTYRILTIDDNPAIHEDFAKIFAESGASASALKDLEAALFGDTSKFRRSHTFELESALQGQEGLERLRAALAGGRPFGVAFVDVRMPPGWDGVQTVEELWKVDPTLQVVLCTAYSDYSWDDIRRRIGNSDSLTILKKPFDNIEVYQLAFALTRKWELARQARAKMEDLDRLVAQRTEELQQTNEQLRREMAERAKAEENFRQAQKMEALGWLAPGLAHDFNNLLTVIRGHIDLLPDVVEGSSIAEVKRQLSAAGERGASLTRQLLCLGRRQAFRPRPVRLARFLQQNRPLLARVLGEHITLEVPAAEGLPCVLADESSLQQLLLNLAAHARECLPDGGALTLSTALVELAPGASKHPDARAGSFLRLTARDTGCGFDAEALARLFEPFAAELPEGASSGLGLATLPAIIKQHGGWIEASSQLRRGTTFDIFLPVTDKVEAPDNANTTPLPNSRPASTEALGASGKVLLLVEDDRDVRGVTRQILKQSGCQILEAGNALEALRLWPQYRGRVDLLVTDMRLPHGIDGRELARRLKAEDPRLRVLYTSGRGTETDQDDAAPKGDTSILAKPYSPRSLLAAVNACFDPAAQALQP